MKVNLVNLWQWLPDGTHPVQAIDLLPAQAARISRLADGESIRLRIKVASGGIGYVQATGRTVPTLPACSPRQAVLYRRGLSRALAIEDGGVNVADTSIDVRNQPSAIVALRGGKW